MAEQCVLSPDSPGHLGHWVSDWGTDCVRDRATSITAVANGAAGRLAPTSTREGGDREPALDALKPLLVVPDVADSAGAESDGQGGREGVNTGRKDGRGDEEGTYDATPLTSPAKKGKDIGKKGREDNPVDTEGIYNATPLHSPAKKDKGDEKPPQASPPEDDTPPTPPFSSRSSSGEPRSGDFPPSPASTHEWDEEKDRVQPPSPSTSSSVSYEYSYEERYEDRYEEWVGEWDEEPSPRRTWRNTYDVVIIGQMVLYTTYTMALLVLFFEAGFLGGELQG